MRPVEAFPTGSHNAFVFAVFNALSFQIVLGSPMVLYAKGLGASATVLGLLTGMMPLLVVFQIPASQYVSRTGYKRFVYAGWGIRVVFIFFIALVPLSGGFLSSATQVALILALMFAFSLSRGISSAGWLPWITTLVPPTLRGRYLSLDAAFTNLASFGAFLVAALCLAGNLQPWRFSMLFLFSAVMGVTSLVFLKRIPDVTPVSQQQGGKGHVPWLAILGHRPFAALVLVAVVWAIAYGGMTAFTVAYLKVFVGLAESKILLVTSVSFLGGLSSLWFLGSRLDALGSRPVITVALFLWLLETAGWLLLSGGRLPVTVWVLGGLQFFMGLLAALVTMANMRLAMAVIPPMGRDHFFALYTVCSSLSLGAAPVAWGLLIDAVGSARLDWLGLEWNRYSVFFAATGLVTCVALVLTRRLHEPEAVSVEKLLRDLLIQSPQRMWVRLWPRQ